MDTSADTRGAVALVGSDPLTNYMSNKQVSVTLIVSFLPFLTSFLSVTPPWLNVGPQFSPHPFNMYYATFHQLSLLLAVLCVTKGQFE